MKVLEISSVNKNLLAESCQGLTTEQKAIVEGIYNDARPLIILSEADLTADQINQLFTSIEQGSTAAGGNRTLAGKAVDAGSAVNQTINKVGKWLQDTRPVQAFDQKFEQLKSTIGQKFPELDKNLTAMGTWARENPGKTAAIIGVLTTLAALGGGPAGGAIAGQILRGTTELLKGEKLSTAVGKGVKTAALGALTGYGVNKIADMLGSGMRLVADNLFPGAQRLNLSYMATGTGPETFQNLRDVVGTAQDLEPIRAGWNQAAQAWGNGQYSQAEALFQQAKAAAAKLADPSYVAQLTQDQSTRQAILAGAKSVMSASDTLAAAAQGAASAATSGGTQTASVQRNETPVNEFVDKTLTVRQWALNESLKRPRGGLYLNEHGIETLFNRVINEGPTWDSIKSGAGNLASQVGQKISTVGKNITTKVTADKLNSAWKKAGAPTDSEKIAQVLKSAGVADDVINGSYSSMKIPAPNLASTPTPSTSLANKAAAAAVAGTMAATAPAASTIPSSNPTQQQTIQPTDPQQSTPQPAQAAIDPQQTPPDQNTTQTASNPFSSPDALLSSFKSYIDAGGQYTPRLRGAVKDIWMQMGGIKAESKSQ